MVVVATVAVAAVIAAPVVGAAAAGAATGAGATATAGAGAAGVTASATAGAGAAPAAAAIAIGPVGWVVLGAEGARGQCTFDCWKAVLHDESLSPSSGKLLREVAADGRIERVVLNSGVPSPGIELHNIWGERFLVEYVTLPSQQIALHASRLN